MKPLWWPCIQVCPVNSVCLILEAQNWMECLRHCPMHAEWRRIIPSLDLQVLLPLTPLCCQATTSSASKFSLLSARVQGAFLQSCFSSQSRYSLGGLSPQVQWFASDLPEFNKPLVSSFLQPLACVGPSRRQHYPPTYQLLPSNLVTSAGLIRVQAITSSFDVKQESSQDKSLHYSTCYWPQCRLWWINPDSLKPMIQPVLSR